MKASHGKARSHSQQAEFSKRSSEASLSRPLTANSPSPKLAPAYSTPKTAPLLRADLTYNKWFIHPSRRLKQSCHFQQQDKTSSHVSNQRTPTSTRNSTACGTPTPPAPSEKSPAKS